jgi:hypothetical protein
MNNIEREIDTKEKDVSCKENNFAGEEEDGKSRTRNKRRTFRLLAILSSLLLIIIVLFKERRGNPFTGVTFNPLQGLLRTKIVLFYSLIKTWGARNTVCCFTRFTANSGREAASLRSGIQGWNSFRKACHQRKSLRSKFNTKSQEG